MRHFLQVYPSGTTGFAFLLVRVSAAAMLVRGGLSLASTGSFLPMIPLLLASALVLGAGTRAVASVSMVYALATLDRRDAVGNLAYLSWAATALAIVLTGPGAFSIDALLFGRKTVRVRDLTFKP